MALIGSQLAARGQLRGGGVVATVMSNLGLERYLAGQGLKLERAKVGDRHVLEAMRAAATMSAASRSGHMILLDHAPPAMAPLPRCSAGALVQSGKRASELLHLFDPVPQLLRNVRFSGGKPLEDARVKAVIAEAEAALAGKGRLVIRPSGTEPVIRVMAEGDDAGEVEPPSPRSARPWRGGRQMMLKCAPIANAAAPTCPPKRPARSSARSNAPSAPNAPMRWTIAAPIAAAN
jgi:phosphoglucosamine mutase